VQPYPALGHFYLSANCKIVQQLLVAGRNTIVIMPIQPFSDWGPLRAKAGVGRLVREIVRFLFANSLVSTITAPRLSIILAGSSTQYFPNNLVPVPDKLPADSDLKITLAAYSAGSNAIIDILQDLLPRGAKITNPRNDLQIRQDYPPKVFASPSSFLDGQWKEYWDVDGFYNDKVGWDPAMKMLDAWHKLSSGRAMRLYHADGTTLGPPPESIPQNAIRTNVSGTLAEGTSNDGTSTWVHVSDTALKGAPEDIKTASFPAFANDDPHHMMPQLVFGHAASFPLR
jgi:hypothetical protein